MTPIEIIALIVIIFAAIKIVILLVKPQAWMDLVQKFSKKTVWAQAISFVLAAVVFWYLLGAGITVVEILAVTAFEAMLMMFGLAPNMGTLITRYKAQISKGTLWKKNWLYTLIWIVLLAWGCKELFF